ncbi:hypothetical protein OAD50_00140 [Vicingaceae bacterium]|nr:hypothetical protein [Vicingaceae bacterium]MDA9782787.1 hypothetical protein [Vicingaceae bacterium]MDB4061884.1 hypothetical protein [Vicingaceae bacterium]MDB9963489.1 hypothetical protein [Vicingaceae bacterium]MDC1451644.1 hypothetical protein [Vicingaceae bacterium]
MISTINFQEHPTNRNLKVFFYSDTDHAVHFEGLLKEQSIEFEKQIDAEGDQKIYYGIHITHFNEVKRLNYLTIGKFRKKFIPDLFFRILLLTISILVLGLAITGALISD